MPNYNKVLLMGNLTRDVELKYTANNLAVGNVGIAVNRRYRTAQGEDREDTAFVDCEVWGRTAEVMSQYLHKGRPVFVEGRLKYDQWQDQQGNNRSKLLVVIENFQFIDSRGGGGDSGGGDSSRASSPPQRTQPARQPSPPSEGGHVPIEEEDIPF